MTVSNQNVRQLYSGDGIQTDFAITFQYQNESEVVVYIRAADGTETLQTVGTSNDYTLTGGNAAAGVLPTDVTFNTAPLATDTVLVIRDISLTQDVDLSQTGGLISSMAVEDQLDKVVLQMQELTEEVGRAAKIEITLSDAGPTIPTAETGKVLGWGASGNLTNLENGVAAVNTLQTITASIAAGGSVNLDTTFRFFRIRVSGAGPGVSFSTTPFGSASWIDGTEVKLIGTSDTNPPTLVSSDVANGVLLNGNREMSRGVCVTLHWDNGISRWIEEGRNV